MMLNALIDEFISTVVVALPNHARVYPLLPVKPKKNQIELDIFRHRTKPK